MNPGNFHSIEKVFLTVSVPGDADGFAWQKRLGRLWRERLQPALETLLDRYDQTAELIRLDKLELNLETVLPGVSDAELTERILRRIDDALHEHTVLNPDAAERMPLHGRLFDHWLYYLEHGVLPWPAHGKPEDLLLESVLATVAAEARAVERLRQTLGRHPGALDRLVQQHPDPFLQQLVEAWSGQKQQDLPGLRLELEQCWQQALREIPALAAIAGAGGVASLRPGFWKMLLSPLGRALPLPAEPALVQALLHSWLSAAAAPLAGTALRSWLQALPAPAFPRVRPALLAREQGQPAPESTPAGPSVKPAQSAEQTASETATGYPENRDVAADLYPRQEEQQIPRTTLGERQEMTGEKEQQKAMTEKTPGEEPETAVPPVNKDAEQPAPHSETSQYNPTPLLTDRPDDFPPGQAKPSTHPAHRPGQEQESTPPRDTPTLPPATENKETPSAPVDGDKKPLRPDAENRKTYSPDDQPPAPPKTESAPSDAETAPPPGRQGAFEALPPGTVYYIRHAGIVLLHPFLPTLFRTLGLVDQNDFTGPEARQRGVLLLEYLATGATGLPEYELLLPRFLCALPLEDPLDRFVSLSDTEKSECDELLAAAIRHWGALGAATPEGLREGFLQREGKLEKRQTGEWYLVVEQKTIDILLDRLPFGWGMSMVKLPWMPEMLRVEWA